MSHWAPIALPGTPIAAFAVPATKNICVYSRSFAVVFHINGPKALLFHINPITGGRGRVSHKLYVFPHRAVGTGGRKARPYEMGGACWIGAGLNPAR